MGLPKLVCVFLFAACCCCRRAAGVRSGCWMLGAGVPAERRSRGASPTRASRARLLLEKAVSLAGGGRRPLPLRLGLTPVWRCARRGKAASTHARPGGGRSGQHSPSQVWPLTGLRQLQPSGLVFDSQGEADTDFPCAPRQGPAGTW
uniref:Melanoma cell adhesion molecule n=1 Tax=Mus musculus TaxID=10090 RepID=D6RFP0_MOUSE